MSDVKNWMGMYYEDGELRRSEVRNDGTYIDLWVGDELRDDIGEVYDLDGLFFNDKEHFAAWVTGHAAALTPEEVWKLVDE